MLHEAIADASKSLGDTVNRSQAVSDARGGVWKPWTTMSCAVSASTVVAAIPAAASAREATCQSNLKSHDAPVNVGCYR